MELKRKWSLIIVHYDGMKPYPWTLVQADVNGASELNIGAFRELEGSEFRRQEIAVHGVEVFEQVRIDGAPARKLCGYCMACKM